MVQIFGLRHINAAGLDHVRGEDIGDITLARDLERCAPLKEGIDAVDLVPAQRAAEHGGSNGNRELLSVHQDVSDVENCRR